MSRPPAPPTALWNATATHRVERVVFGYCGTDRRVDEQSPPSCGSSGFGASRRNVTSLEQCAALCAACGKDCSYASFSRILDDCSLYRTCNVRSLVCDARHKYHTSIAHRSNTKQPAAAAPPPCPHQSSSTACSIPLFIFVHIPKTGGSALDDHLPTRLQMKRCSYVKSCCDEHVPSAGQLFAERFTCDNKCNYAASEWSYSHLARAGALNLTTRPQLVTFVREPIAWFRSKVEHDLTFPGSTGAAPGDRYHSVDEALTQAGTGTGYAQFFPNFQSRWALAPQRMVGGATTRNASTSLRQALRADYFFVGVTEWMWHSLCVLDYRMGAFAHAKCDCKIGPSVVPFMKNPFNAKQKHTVDVSYSSDQMKRAQTLLRHDELLYAAALQDLVESVQEIERETGADLLRCFSSRRA